MALATKVILQVSYPADIAYKTMAFSPDLTIEECRNLAAKKGGIDLSKKELYGFFNPTANQWMKLEDKLNTYNLANRATVEFKLMPDEHTVYFDGQTLTPRLNYQANVGQVIESIAEQLGEKAGDFLLLANNDGDVSKGTLLDLKKPLIDQAKPGKTNLVLKRKKAGIFKSKSRASVVVPQALQARKMFGQPLNLITSPKVFNGLPPVVEKSIAYLEESYLELEGIFRISGNQTEVTAMKAAFDDGKDVDVATASSPHVVACALKLFLREMPEPLFTYDFYEVFLAIYGTVKNAEAKVLYYKVLIDALPQPNRLLLFRLLPYLSRVIEHEAVNKMAIHNIATVFGPNLLRSADESPMTLIQDTAAINGITSELVKNQDIVTGEAEHDFISIGQSTYGYTGQTESELTFVTGDMVFIVKEDDTGWWEGEINGQYGFFPTNYVKVVMQLPNHSDKKTDKTKPAAGSSTPKPAAAAPAAAPATAPATAPAASPAPSAPSKTPSAAAATANAAAAAVAAKKASAPKTAPARTNKPANRSAPVREPKKAPAIGPPSTAPAKTPDSPKTIAPPKNPPAQALQVAAAGSQVRKSASGGGGGGGLSKKQFMQELEGMKKGVTDEKIARMKLEKALAKMLIEMKSIKELAKKNADKVIALEKAAAKAPSAAPAAASAASTSTTLPPELKTDIEDLKSDSEVLQEEVENLQAFRRDSNNQVSALETTVKALQSQVEALKAENESLKANLPLAGNRKSMRGRGRGIIRGTPRGRGRGAAHQ